MTYFKVCGMSRLEDVDLAIEAGATHIGIIMAPGSKRCLEPTAAERVRRHIGDRARPVLVVRRQAVDEVLELADQLDIRWIQLHGGYEPSDAERISDEGFRIIWATPVHPDGQWVPFDGVADFLLLDTSKAGAFGGTGTSFDWASTKRPELPFFVAGGIGNHNAVAAFSALRPDGLDFNSALEEAPAKKSPDALRTLAKTIRDIRELSEQPTAQI